MIHIGLREANQHFAQYIEAVESGEEVLITRHGKPIAKLISVNSPPTLSKKQKAAWKRTLSRMEKGFNLGGEKFSREKLYET